MIRVILAGLAVTTLLMASGCVSKAEYQLKLDETEHLQTIIRNLEADYERLAAEKRQLNQRNDTLNLQRLEEVDRSSQLRQDLMRARGDLDRVERVLADRSAETGQAMAEMRATIDRLETQAQDLNQQLEVERTARRERLNQIKGTYDELVGKLESEIARGEVQISELKGKLTVNVVDRILFDSGAAQLKQEGINVLQRIGATLKTASDKEVQIEGHTDNVPIRGSLTERFPSNWELSTARATNVLHFLQQTVGIPGERLSAVGYGEYRPLASNSSAEGRRQNRRIQIVLSPLK